MNKTDNNNRLVPELRFPEFKNMGNWVIKNLEDIAINGFSNGVFNDPKKVGHGYKLINVVDMYLDTPINESTLSLIGISKQEFIKNKVVFGDVFFTRSSLVPTGIAQSNIYLGNAEDVTFDGHLIRLRPKLTLIVPLFLHYILKTDNCRSQLISKGKVATMTTIAQNDIAPTEIALTSISEQQKIADCLSSLDEFITAQSQKFLALQAHKKGLLQNLFPAKGETVPLLRFTEFDGDGDWVERNLGQVVHYENGKAHEQDIDEQGNYIVVNSKFISTEGEVKKYSNSANLLAKKGDILMVLSDVPNGRAIAKCFYVDKDNTYTVNQRICKLTSKKAVSLVLFYVINRNSYFLTFDDGVKQTNLRKDDVLNCPLLLPKNPKEQQKIADCLFSIDELITSQSQIIESLKAHKKGLMQQLFPNTNELVNE